MIPPRQGITMECRFREADDAAQEAFFRRGIKRRHYFSHRVYVLPKCGPDGLKLARWMAGCNDASRLREVVLYAIGPLVERFPRELYFDDEIQWHQQQFGRPGQIACANLIVEENSLRCYLLVSDLVQRISRAPAHRTQIDNQFKGWSRLLLNAVLCHAIESSKTTVYSASSRLALRNTDQERNPKPPLYERIYDRTAQDLGGVLEGDWWRIEIDGERIAPLERRSESQVWPRTVCLLRDAGPSGPDENNSELEAARRAAAFVEKALSVPITYAVPPRRFNDYQAAMVQEGCGIAFRASGPLQPLDSPKASSTVVSERLVACRHADYRLKGYCASPDELFGGLRDSHLAEFNFEWLAAPSSFLGSEIPFVENSLVKLPIHQDDCSMIDGEIDFKQWQTAALKQIEDRGFVVIRLHDGQARNWLPFYESFLRSVQQMAELTTLNDVAARITLGSAIWKES